MPAHAHTRVHELLPAVQPGRGDANEAWEVVRC